MKYVSIKDGVVDTVSYSPSPNTIEAPDSVFAGFTYDGVGFYPPSIPVSPTQVNIERDRRVLSGGYFEVTGHGSVRVAGDDTTMRNLQGLAFAAQLRLAAGDTTTITPYRDEDNVIHQLLPAQLIELYSKGAAFVSDVYQKSWTLKDGPSIPVDYTEDTYWT